MRAAGAGHEAAVNILISKGIQVDEQDKVSVVHYYLLLCIVLLSINRRCGFGCYTHKKHPPNCVSLCPFSSLTFLVLSFLQTGRTALHYACLHQKEKVLPLLLQAGANPFILDKVCKTKPVFTSGTVYLRSPRIFFSL